MNRTYSGALTLSHPTDPMEREAERTAAQFMRMPVARAFDDFAPMPLPANVVPMADYRQRFDARAQAPSGPPIHVEVNLTLNPPVGMSRQEAHEYLRTAGSIAQAETFKAVQRAVQQLVPRRVA